MTKEFTLRMPDEIHELLLSLKEKFRVSMTSKIMDYVCRGLINDGYYPISNLIALNKTPIRVQITAQSAPEGIKYCDGDSCEIPVKSDFVKRVEKFQDQIDEVYSGHKGGHCG